MKPVIEGGQGGWLQDVREPDAEGQLGEVRTAGSFLREQGVPVEQGRELAEEKQARDRMGRWM